MKFAFVFAIALSLFLATANAQIKNTGIKTHYPSSDNLMAERNNEHSYSRLYNRNFIPADVYEGDNRYNNAFVSGTKAPVELDATAEFINRTRASISPGLCWKEVPANTVHLDPHAVIRGNGSKPYLSKIEVCCEGYERNPHIWARCDPICENDCPNGICTAPNTCICIPGHVRNELGRCISICPIGCGNGDCNERNECICKPGYVLEPSQRKYCEPKCEPACAFGKCVEPNKCACLDNYGLTGNGNCEPKCDNCENGRCTAPGSCTCNPGYEKVASGGCEPICEKGCQNGRCIAPGRCACSSGYLLDANGSSCQAHCDQPCLNGVCSGANRCTCNDGYVQDELQYNICKPHCPHGCPNGFCSGPNLCICRPGFIKNGIKGRQTCVPV